MRSGIRLEVREYGDPGGHPAFFFHGLIGSHHQASYIDEQAKERGGNPVEIRCPAAHNAVGLAGESPAVGIDCLST